MIPGNESGWEAFDLRVGIKQKALEDGVSGWVCEVRWGPRLESKQSERVHGQAHWDMKSQRKTKS